MTNVIVAFPKPEDAKSIRNILVKNGFPVVAVCTSGAQTLQYADDLHNGVVVCGYRLTDMIYSQLREDLSEQFDMLLLASRRFTSEVDDKRIRCVAMPLKVHELLASVDAAVEESELRKKKARQQPKQRNVLDKQQIMLAKDAPYKEQFIRALNDMDIDITDYRYDEDSHQLFMKRNLGTTEYELPFSEESDGTRKLIAALPVILLALREGRMVIIDELDAKLHPKLLKYVIFLFKNKEINQYGAQLLFTSHDMYTLKNTVFRRDEIWFAAENNTHESEIYSLHEIRGEDNDRIKNTAAYDKQYLEGRYGADPYLSNMLGGEF